MKDLLGNLLCSNCCSNVLFLDGDKVSCVCGNKVEFGNHNILQYTKKNVLDTISEVKTRNKQASGYLQHVKFPIQIFRLKQFLNSLPSNLNGLIAVDLGCGPGPGTSLLMKKGFKVIAVDFSEESLILNKEINSANLKNILFVEADLNQFKLRANSAYCILMCDVLQHIGDKNQRSLFLKNAFESLMPGGYFHMTFFNFNLKNYLKGDMSGSFSIGTIKYERLLFREVIAMFPEDIEVKSILPMNISNDVYFDRLLSTLPGAKYLSRMIAISGIKRY